SQRKVEREPKVLALLLEQLEVVVAEQRLVEAALGQRRVVLEVTTLHDVLLPRSYQSFGGKLADRLEHPEAWGTRSVAPAQQVLVQERLQHVWIRAGDLLRRLEAAAPGEDAHPPKETLLLRIQEVVAPGDRRPQRLLPRVDATVRPQQIEPLCQTLEQLPGAEDNCTRGRQLERQRQI